MTRPLRQLRTTWLRRFKRVGQHAGLETERPQRRQRVRGEHHAAAELAQARRLLIDRDLHAAQQQGAGRRQPANAAADDGDAQRSRHPSVPLPTRLYPFAADTFTSAGSKGTLATL